MCIKTISLDYHYFLRWPKIFHGKLEVIVEKLNEDFYKRITETQTSRTVEFEGLIDLSATSRVTANSSVIIELEMGTYFLLAVLTTQRMGKDVRDATEGLVEYAMP